MGNLTWYLAERAETKVSNGGISHSPSSEVWAVQGLLRDIQLERFGLSEWALDAGGCVTPYDTVKPNGSRR